MSKVMVKHSIKRQIAVSFMILMAGTLLLCFLLNSTFLQSFYEQNKEKSLVQGYHKIIRMVEMKDITSNQYADELMALSERADISGIILDPDAQDVYYFGNVRDILYRRVRDFLYNDHASGTEIIEQREEYILLKTLDRQTQSEYLEIHGMVDSGEVFMLRTPLANVTESVKLSNQFLLYVGVLAVVLSCVVIWFMTKKITEPILELADISERMTRLDFEAKYTGKDQTEISLLGANINRLSATLEKTISELKTANNELQKDIEKKNQVDEMRKEFLSNVSHELKTPLALIQGYAEGLQEGVGEDPESMKFYCDVIIDEAAKMNTMVKKLTTLNQLEFGNDVAALERFDVVELICNYVQSALILTQQNQIQVRMEHYDPIYVWADEFKTEEVFMNYFSNAVNHATGEKIIDVKLQRKGQKVRVSVFNTGEAIPQESLAHIWEKFYKVDKARTREYGGSGVGLSIVKAIMESMNQDYGVINYDNGVEFWFELETVT